MKLKDLFAEVKNKKQLVDLTDGKGAVIEENIMAKPAVMDGEEVVEPAVEARIYTLADAIEDYPNREVIHSRKVDGVLVIKTKKE